MDIGMYVCICVHVSQPSFYSSSGRARSSEGLRAEVEHRTMCTKRDHGTEEDEFCAELAAMGVPRRKIQRTVELVRSHPSIVQPDATARTGSRWHRSGVARRYSEFLKHCTAKLSFLLDDGQVFVLEYMDPNQLLLATLAANDQLRDAFHNALRSRPAMPWDVLWGADEVFSGNALHKSGRKTWIISFSFSQLGRKNLVRSAFWWTAAVFRTEVCKHLPGGISRVMKILLRSQLLHEANGLATVGLPIQTNAGIVLLRARFDQLIADGDGWKQIIEAKGASGLRCCPKCTNVWAMDSGMTDGKSQVDIACSDASAFVLHTAESLKQVIAQLFKAQSEKHIRGGKTRLGKLEKVAGFAPTRHGIWSDPELVEYLDLPGCVLIDWAHCALSEGVFSHELVVFVGSLPEDDKTQLHDFLLDWKVPANLSRRSFYKLRRFLIDGRMSGLDRPSSSECLDFVASLGAWLTLQECASRPLTSSGHRLLRLCNLIASIQVAKFGVGPNERHGRLQITQLWESWKSTLPTSSTIPKSHWLSHVSSYKSILVDTFIVERLHRRAKLFSSNVKNTHRFEKTVVEMVFGHQCKADIVDRSFAGPLGHPGSGQALWKTCVVEGIPFGVGGFVRFAGEVGQIVGCSEGRDGDVDLLVRQCTPRTCRPLRSSWFNFVAVQSVAEKWDASDCESAVAWKSYGEDFLVLFRP